MITELPTRGPQLLDQVHRVPFISHINLSGLNAKVQGFASNFAEYLFLSISGWASKLADIVAVIFLTIYFMLEGDEAYHWVLSFFPKSSRGRLNDTLLRADVRMGKWLLGQGGLMLILGLCSLIVFVLLKIRYAYALAVLMGALNIIPIVGAMVSMALVLLAAATDSWEKVVGVMIFYGIYAQVETSYLTPRIMKSSVDLPALGVLVALLMGSKLAGVIGAMIAVPTAVLVSVLIQEYLVQHDDAGRMGADRCHVNADAALKDLRRLGYSKRQTCRACLLAIMKTVDAAQKSRQGAVSIDAKNQTIPPSLKPGLAPVTPAAQA